MKQEGWKISAELPKPPLNPDEELRLAYEHIRTLITKGVPQVTKRRTNILSRSKSILAEFGEAFDQADLLATIKQLVDLAAKHGISGSTTGPAMSRLVDRVQNARTAEVLDQIRLIQKDSEGGPMMSAIAKLDVETHSLLVDFAETCVSFVKERTASAQATIGNWTQSLLASKTKEVDTILLALETTASRFKET